MLVLVIEYDNAPSDVDLEDVMDKARELGGVSRADLFSLVPAKRSLL